MIKFYSIISKLKNNSSGFTLIELLVVLVLISILFTMVLVAINPVKQRSQANNAKRQSDISEILNAVYHYEIDNGEVPSDITSSLKLIGTTLSACDATTCAGEFPQATCVDLDGVISTEYIASIPFDPTTGNTSNTRYGIKKSIPNNRITVKACDAELGETISVTK